MLRATAVAALLVLTIVGEPHDNRSSCRLSLTPEPGFWSEATGQHTLAYVLTNRGPRACTLDGYPKLEFRDAKGRLPLVIHRGGDQMITNQPPGRVRFAPGRQAYVAVNKYRCDRGDKRDPLEVVLVPPGGGTPLSAPVRGRFTGWCGPGDPGSVVSVTPIEPTLHALSAH